MKPIAFRLQFEPTQIPYWASRYDIVGDELALAAGRYIAGGEYIRQHFEVIFKWKTNGRGISRLHRNSDAEVAEALRFAAAASTERCAIAVLCGLSGVDVPLAWAVMTAIHPAQYTVIDFRSLEALGAIAVRSNLGFYLGYLKYCRSLADQNKADLRTLDRALWQWSKESSRPSESSEQDVIPRVGHAGPRQ